jgi:hypothetical protein
MNIFNLFDYHAYNRYPIDRYHLVGGHLLCDMQCVVGYSLYFEIALY